jgi:alkanesulfonate monooxygenase SsuD/methylene tetrahydromethanopterin reductase-like flavin-dependent oxidoreductase (luciferase family)
MEFGILIADVPTKTDPRQQLRDIFKIVEAAQANGIRYITIGQHFLYGDLRWLQPIPLLARLAAEVDADVRLVPQVLIAPLYHPVLLAEELATLDIVTEGRLEVGLGLGYRPEEFDFFGVPFKERAPRLNETLELLRALWTEPTVTHHGRFWTLDGVQPHIQPVQSPYPPLWIGGQSNKAAVRAGKYGDFFPVPPETTEQEIAERFALVKEGFVARGKPFGPQPVRRNVHIGKDNDDAMREFTRVAQGRYITYAQRGQQELLSADDLEKDFIHATASHAFVGATDDVINRIRGFVQRLPVSPIILKPQWPGMTGDETVAAINAVGSTVIAALRDQAPLADLPETSAG